MWAAVCLLWKPLDVSPLHILSTPVSALFGADGGEGGLSSPAKKVTEVSSSVQNARTSKLEATAFWLFNNVAEGDARVQLLMLQRDTF